MLTDTVHCIRSAEHNEFSFGIIKFEEVVHDHIFAMDASILCMAD